MIPAKSDRGILPYLDTFVVAAESGNFTHAAETLRITQAAVSQRVQALERILGQSLFRRSRGGVQLTESGKKLHGYARKILDLERDALRDIAHRAAPLEGKLTLAASSIPGEHLLPTLVSEFQKKYPRIRVQAAIADSSAVGKRVEKGEASLGFVGTRLSRSHLDHRFLASDDMILAVPADHPLARRKAISWKQLIGQPCLLREPGSGLRDEFDLSVRRAGLDPAELQVVMELGSNEAIKEAVLRGVGVGILSNWAVRKDAAGGRLAALRLRGVETKRDLYLVLDSRRPLEPAAVVFLAFLESHPLIRQA